MHKLHCCSSCQWVQNILITFHMRQWNYFFVLSLHWLFLLFTLQKLSTISILLILPLDGLSFFDVETIYFRKSAATALLGYSLLYLVGSALRWRRRIMLLLSGPICQNFLPVSCPWSWAFCGSSKNKQPLCPQKFCNQHLATIPNTEVLIGSITEKVWLFQDKNRR